MSWEQIGVITTAIIGVGGLIVWAMRSIVAPLGVVVQNNTDALKELGADLKDVNRVLGEHGEELASIRTRHEIEDREGGR